MTEFLETHNMLGLAIGLCAFLTIGIFHPLVIKGEYHLGVKCWWMFLVAGVVLLACSIAVEGVLWQSILGVAGFSCFWSILEIKQQQERVHKGWFPRNPRRRYPWDDDATTKE